MITCNYFDCLNTKYNQALNTANQYFFLEGISDSLGFRKYNLINPNEAQRIRHSSQLDVSKILLTIIKIISYITILIPLIFFIIKSLYFKNRTFKYIPIFNRKNLSDPILAKDFLEKQKKDFFEGFPFSLSPHIQNLLNILYEDKKLQPYSCIFAESGYANLFKEFDNHPEVAFLHKIDFKISEDRQLKRLAKSLEASFATGAKFVITRLSSTKHVLAAAFKEDGSFILVDSMKKNTVNVDYLTEDLNDLDIKNSKGQKITFTGKYVCTYLQSYCDNQCVRFAALYIYQMAKKRDFEAYQEVNGAFAEKRLTTFEDISKIDGSKKIQAFSPIQTVRDLYLPFMKSWAYRSLFSYKNDWKEIKIKEIISANENLEFIIIKKDPDSLPETISVQNPFIWKDKQADEVYINDIEQLSQQFKSLNTNPEMTLSELIPSDCSDCTIICFEKENSKPYIFKLPRTDLKNFYNLKKQPIF